MPARKSRSHSRPDSMEANLFSSGVFPEFAPATTDTALNPESTATKRAKVMPPSGLSPASLHAELSGFRDFGTETVM